MKAQRDRMPWPTGPPPLLVKVAPDLTADEMKVPSAWLMLAGANLLTHMLCHLRSKFKLLSMLCVRA